MAYQIVYGIVNSKDKAELVIQDLINMSINADDISFLSSQGEHFKDWKTAQTQMETNRNWRTEERVTDYPSEQIGAERTYPKNFNKNAKGGLGTEKHTKAPEGATTGAAAGGVIGATLGLLAGIGALAIPGMGPFIAAGPLLATLSGIGVGGTLGGLIGALVGAGIPEFEAKHYENRLKEGGILISVRTNSDAFLKQVKDLFKRDGVEDVTVSSESTTSKSRNK